ncbi:MAG: putative zinc-binding protein [Candidatus Omnitrophica bacterium]|nr:putative zinc-binding protein [Candidatus Omnitrophota bacterium]
MAQNSCMCQEAGVLVFSCSGVADVGEITDRVARKIAKCGQAKMFCLAGIGAHVSVMIESAKAAKKIVAIDGCPVSCAKKTLEHAGFNVIAHNLKNMGFEKGKTKVNEANIEKIASIITGGKVEKNISNSSSCYSS